MTREDALRKLKKMRAKMEGAQKLGSELEAQAFAEAIQKMCAQHQVNEAELDPQTLDEIDPVERVFPDYDKHKYKVRQRWVDWLDKLADSVSWAHYCSYFTYGNTSRVSFVGRRSNAETAAEVYLQLAILAEEIADREYVDFFYKCKAEGQVGKARGFRHSFLLGFCRRVSERYYEYQEALKKYYAHDQKALVSLGDARKKVRDWIKAQDVKEASDRKNKGVENWSGYHEGVKKANDVEMTKSRMVEGA